MPFRGRCPIDQLLLSAVLICAAVLPLHAGPVRHMPEIFVFGVRDSVRHVHRGGFGQQGGQAMPGMAAPMAPGGFGGGFGAQAQPNPGGGAFGSAAGGLVVGSVGLGLLHNPRRLSHKASGASAVAIWAEIRGCYREV